MESTYPELVWRQTSPGLWQRSIDEVEESYSALATLYEGSGLMFFAITGHVSLNVDVPKDMPPSEAEALVDQALSKAWVALRYDHPTIASQVTQDLNTGRWTKTYHQFQNKLDQAAWLKDTFVPLSVGQTGAQWANSNPPAPKVPTLFVLGLPSGKEGVIRRDIVLRSPHDIIDGIGTLTLLNNFIAHASKAYAEADAYQPPIFDGSEAANLSPPYRVAANAPPVLTEAQQKRLAHMAAQKTAAMQPSGIEVLALPYTHGASLPSRHQRVAHTLNEDQTARLLKACKAADATVTHAFHAAIALVVRDIQERGPEAKRVRYVNYILRNERASCQSPYNSSKHPAALYHSVPGQSLIVDMNLPAAGDNTIREDEFLPIVQLMKDFYHDVKNDAEHYALAPVIWAAGTPALPTHPRPLPVPPPKTHPSVSISSMGRVDGIIAPKTGAFAAYDPWVTGEELCNGLGLFLGTFRGEMCLSAAYNDAWHTEATVLDFLKRCEDVVFRGFKISSS
ncbi:hypothetical protein CKAH01_10718 [Colletotrichum kahawae]|uniref:Uncharacterized protein n=1 Tax=Colletotrichum kahawae TaxID=34407 RepID=A0AAD9XWX5_COLKA|nr:hypothetical protein CKAH01_10718 [Colletotrichum kahawae]